LAYIYQIKNKINDKIYIGKTQFDIEKRFKEHCRDAFKDRCEKRPLYAAMQKYGIENFEISILEETDNPEDREIYWIEQKRSFKNGYNATIGGDGKKYLDYDVLIATYLQTQSLSKTAELCHCDDHHLSNILKSNNINVLSSQEVNKLQFSNCINQYDLNNQYIQTFSSAKEAARFIRPEATSLGGVTSHITDVCKGKRKTAYGFKWQYAN
jgi:group I intron endonuclease